MAALAVEAFMLVFIYFCKVYDLSTAMIFAFALGFMARGKFGAFYLLYPLGCLNRETMFLLSAFFAVHYFWKMEAIRYLLRLAYQGFAFFGIRVLVMKIFEGNAGQAFYFQPWQVFGDYWSHPFQSFLLITLIARHL